MTAFHLQLKPAGARCPLACGYCYYRPADAGGPATMPDEVLEAALASYLASQPGPVIELAWQGGEPTVLGVEWFRRAFALADRLRPAGTTIAHSLQTSGVLLDDAWCALLAEHRALVGVSLDGPPALHDPAQPTRGGGATCATAVRALARLAAHGVETNVLCAIHAGNADRPLDVYRFLRDEAGARFLQLLPVAPRDRVVGAVAPAALGRFLCAVFDAWVARDVGEVFVQQFDGALAAWLGLPAATCVHAPTCGDALVVERDGDVYPCDHAVGPAHRLGWVRERPLAALAASPAARAFGRAKLDGLGATCRACDVRFACHGGCPRDRDADGRSRLCDGYRAFFRHVDAPMRAMAALVGAGRSATEIMAR